MILEELSMIDTVRRIFVEKKSEYAVESQKLLHDLRLGLNLKNVDGIRIVNCYDVSGISDEEYERSKVTVFSEKNVDNIYEENFKSKNEDKIFALEFLPGQYDQRADSASQCIQILTQHDKPNVHFSRFYILSGNISNKEFEKIKNYCINPVDSRQAKLEKPETLEIKVSIPEDVEILNGFISMDDDKLRKFLKEKGLAMSFDDLKFCRNYFKDNEKREPSITEIKVIDTYWSDHCRHTTFMTEIKDVEIENGIYTAPIKEAYEAYLNSREYVYDQKLKPICLMDIAVIGMKELKKKGMLKDIDESDEINACSIVVDAKVNGKSEKWLVMFKNETHNHPTEIEPFGGAATCLGGAIRDPLSGRSYVYQAMRVTGCGNPNEKIENTLKGRLPQRKLTLGAAQGYSSYGNQIGLATGQVTEVYDDDYRAKRMEIGAVIGAVPQKNVVRIEPIKTDIVILVGGRTGRDGCGGATGSSKEHDENSIVTCGSEVQKGNAPTERKIQRLFRNSEVSRMVKRCNDFGAGGVSVAIGELTEGIDIDLDLVPKKYAGLDGTELAISESQERMAVVVAKENAEKFIRLAALENLEATKVAVVTDTGRLVFKWNGKIIVDISREFLNTNGAKQETCVKVLAPNADCNYFNKKNNVRDLKEAWIQQLSDLNICSQKGLVERFDSSIGAATVLMPFGGRYQMTPQEGMAAKLPVLNGETDTGTMMSFGFNNSIAKWSPFHGAMYAVVEATAKITAMGGDFSKIRLTFQEYFEKPGNDPKRWGKPFSAMLGAHHAQLMLGIPAIGGKDSMSGTFNDMDVPPTLVAFAVDVFDPKDIISAEFKKSGSTIVLIPAKRNAQEMPDFITIKKNYSMINKLMKSGVVLAASTVKRGGIAETISKMSFGNKIGMVFEEGYDSEGLFAPDCGSIILELKVDADIKKLFCKTEFYILGKTQAKETITVNNINIDITEAIESFEKTLEDVFPTKMTKVNDEITCTLYNKRNISSPLIKLAKPKVFIPVFPGTNCEYDSMRAFVKAGADAEVMVFNNLTPQDIEESIEKAVKLINLSQIIMLPGGFSAGDEPEGSGKFIAAVLKNSKMSEAVMNLLNNRDGLMLGICNGFQALIKLGLVPYGSIRDINLNSPTLTYNSIGRHTSRMVKTKIVSTLSPWFSQVNIGDVFTVPVSHGEGRFVSDAEIINSLIKNGQIATQYVDLEGNPTYDIEFNPNGSMFAIEGITSPDGRILGKMAHSERIGNNVAVNIEGMKNQKIFESGVSYFK